jgi:hypothetical protein
MGRENDAVLEAVSKVPCARKGNKLRIAVMNVVRGVGLYSA